MTARALESKSAPPAAVYIRQRLMPGRGFGGLIGRTRETRTFMSWLGGLPTGGACAYVHGPPGIGKSALVRALERRLRRAGWLVERVPDGRVERSAARARSRPTSDDEAASPCWSTTGTRSTATGPIAERIERARGRKLVLFASRSRSHHLFRQSAFFPARWLELELGPLTPDASYELLTRSNLDLTEAQVSATVAEARGSPLLLKLRAEQAAASGRAPRPLLPGGQPDAEVTRTVVESFFRSVDDRERATTLEVASLLQQVDESDLEVALELSPGDARRLFIWLRGLSIAQPGHYGVRVHDVVSDIVARDLVLRDVVRASGYVERVLHALVPQLARGGPTRARALERLFALGRHSPSAEVSSLFQRHDPLVGMLAERELEAALGIVQRHRGAAMRDLVARWFAAAPRSAIVARSEASEEIEGILLLLDLHDDATPRSVGDDVLVRTLERAEADRLWRPGEPVRALRIVVSRDDGDAPSPTFGRLVGAANSTTLMFRQAFLGLVFLGELAPWVSSLPAIGYAPMPGFEEDDEHPTFMRIPADPVRIFVDGAASAWNVTLDRPPPSARPTSVADDLLRDEIVDALRHLRDPLLLGQCALGRRLFPETPGTARGEALEAWLVATLGTLETLPRGSAIVTAIRASFGVDRSNAEAARAARMSESTLKRHRRSGIDHLVVRARAKLAAAAASSAAHGPAPEGVSHS
ncbi:MAG: AAA family ATPase [Labilithrix sp.]|nr:AAA family ATPase [Labilithrix sp.]